MALELIEEAGIEGLPIAGGDIGHDMADIPHAWDDGRDCRIRQDPSE
jgi:hypothetical protein